MGQENTGILKGESLFFLKKSHFLRVVMCAFLISDRIARFHLLYLQEEVAHVWEVIGRWLPDLRESGCSARRAQPHAFSEEDIHDRSMEPLCRTDPRECLYTLLEKWAAMSPEKHTVERLKDVLEKVDHGRRGEMLTSLKKTDVDYVVNKVSFF